MRTKEGRGQKSPIVTYCYKMMLLTPKFSHKILDT